MNTTNSRRDNFSRYIVSRAREDEPEIDQPPDAANGVVPKLHFRWVLTGPSKSGKTNLARWCLDHYYMRAANKSWFDKIYLLSPTGQMDWNWADLPGLEKANRIVHPKKSDLRKILSDARRQIQGGGMAADIGKRNNLPRLARNKRKADKILIIFDDAIAESSLINSAEFLKIFIQGRHYNISSMVMSQSYVKVPRSVRIQATHVSMFPSRASEIERLYADHGPKELSKREFISMVAEATDPQEGDEYPFLFVDVFAPAQYRFRRNFTQQIEIGDSRGDEEVSEVVGDEVGEEEVVEEREVIPRSKRKRGGEEGRANDPGQKRRKQNRRSQLISQ